MADVIVKSQKSKIHGRGVFASRDFKKGETVINWLNPPQLTEQQAKNLPEKEKKYLSYIGNGKFVLLQPPTRFINHSCDPNTYVKNQKDIARRDIRKGEEITADYSLEGVVEWEFKCNCRTKNCRKTIYGNFSKLDAKTQEQLKSYLQDWYWKENRRKGTTLVL